MNEKKRVPNFIKKIIDFFKRKTTPEALINVLDKQVGTANEYRQKLKELKNKMPLDEEVNNAHDSSNQNFLS